MVALTRHAGRYMPVRARIGFIACCVVLLGAKGCPKAEPERPAEPDELPAVASIEIVPAHVSVPSGVSVTLLAQLKDQWGTVLSDPRVESVSWRTTQGPTVPAGPSSSVVVTTSAGIPMPAQSIVVIVASFSGVTVTDTITVMPPSSPASQTNSPSLPPNSPSDGSAGDQLVPSVDWIRAPYSGSALPSQADLPTIALVDGISGGVQQDDTPFGFVESRDVGGFSCRSPMCGEITLFSPTLGVRRDSVNWTAGCDFVDFVAGTTVPTWCQAPASSSPPAPLPTRIRVPVVIWQASNAADVDSIIAGDTAYLMSVFAQPWLGLDLDVTVRIAAVATETLRYYDTCHDPTYDISKQLLGIPYAEFLPDRIIVAYVDRIVSAHAESNEISAFACYHYGSQGPIVLISHAGAGASTLAHELGHALGQWSGAIVHTDTLEGFDESNLLLSAESSHSRAIRKHLTLGQVFQISFRDLSFVKLAAGLRGVPCSATPTSSTPCPRLAKDVIP